MCAAGGWVGGGASDEPAALVAAHADMLSRCLQPALTAAHFASSGYLSARGLLLLVGAEAARHGTPSMLAYGCAKAATHQLARSVAPLPDGARCLAIAPRVLDTPSNRRWMADAETSAWTPLPAVAAKIVALADETASGASGVAPSGALLVPRTAAACTEWDVFPT